MMSEITDQRRVPVLWKAIRAQGGEGWQVKYKERQKKEKSRQKRKTQRDGGGGSETRWEFFFFEWSPMAGPDGEERREWRAPVSAAPKEDVMRLHG